MKIWVIGRGVPTKTNSMLGSFELEQAQALLKQGEEVIYLSFNRSICDYRNMGISIKKIGRLPSYSFNIPVGSFLPVAITQFIINRRFSSLSKKIIEKHGVPDIIHVHYPALMYFTELEELKRQGVRIVATEHWTKVQDNTISAFYLNNLKSYRRLCYAFICVSSCLQKTVMELTGIESGLYIVPNMVLANFVSEFKPHEGVVFLVSGRLIEEKQVDKVIQSFIRAFNKDENVSLIIAGGGKQFRYLKKIIEKEKRNNQIHLLGTVSRKKMAEIMSMSDVLVTYSRMETFCVPVVEAWMCGKPVIASNDIPVIIDNPDKRLGIAVDCEETKELEVALKAMSSQYKDYDADFIRTYARERFSEEAVSKQLLKIYGVK